jgi:hypothetical protein
MSRNSVKRLASQILMVSLFASLISMTACSRRYVVVEGGETTPVKKADLDRLYQDNELLLKALEECRSGR